MDLSVGLHCGSFIRTVAGGVDGAVPTLCERSSEARWLGGAGWRLLSLFLSKNVVVRPLSEEVGGKGTVVSFHERLKCFDFVFFRAILAPDGVAHACSCVALRIVVQLSVMAVHGRKWVLEDSLSEAVWRTILRAPFTSHDMANLQLLHTTTFASQQAARESCSKRGR